MKFLQSLTSGLKEAVGIEKKFTWGEDELAWFHRFEGELSKYRQSIEKRAAPYYSDQYQLPLLNRREFVELCRSIMKSEFGLNDEELAEIMYDDVFETHLKAQDKDFGDNLEAVCFIKCLVTPFREPSNFFYFFALSDTNCSGGLDTLEFKRMLLKKFKGSGNSEKVDELMEEYFPASEDNVFTSWMKKMGIGKNEVSIKEYVQAFPQDLLQECSCSQFIDECTQSK